MAAENAIFARRSTPGEMQKVTAENVDRFIASLSVKPLFEEARRLWDRDGEPTLVMTSHAHINPNNTCRYLVGHQMLNAMLDAAGVPASSARNILYNIGRPDMDSPVGTKIQFGSSNPKIFKGDVMYALQNSHAFKPEPKGLRSDLLKAYGTLDVVEERVDTVLDLLFATKARLDAASTPTDLSLAIIALRRAQYELIGTEYVAEEPLHLEVERITDVLELMDRRYGKPFYEMPVTKEFDMTDLEEHPSWSSLLEALEGGRYVQSSHLKAIDSGFNAKGKDMTGVRVPVVFNGERFAFFFSDDESRLQGRGFEYEFDAKRGIVFIGKDEIYKAMRAFILVPTVPVKMYADTVAPQIPQLGGPQWAKYAPEQIKVSAEWLGIPEEDARTLYLTTLGLVTYGIRYMHDGKSQGMVEGDGLLHGFFASYITFGGENMLRTITEGTYVEVDFGTVVKDGADFGRLLR